jgi:hypothetical protein
VLLTDSPRGRPPLALDRDVAEGRGPPGTTLHFEVVATARYVPVDLVHWLDLTQRKRLRSSTFIDWRSADGEGSVKVRRKRAAGSPTGIPDVLASH